MSGWKSNLIPDVGTLWSGGLCSCALTTSAFAHQDAATKPPFAPRWNSERSLTGLRGASICRSHLRSARVENRIERCLLVAQSGRLEAFDQIGACARGGLFLTQSRLSKIGMRIDVDRLNYRRSRNPIAFSGHALRIDSVISRLQ